MAICNATALQTRSPNWFFSMAKTPAKRRANRRTAEEDALTDLTAPLEVQRTIKAAESGDLSAAWVLIDQIRTALRESRRSKHLFGHAAAFFDELLAIADSAKGHATRDDLARALAKLHIIRGRGQPERENAEKYRLGSKVLLLERTGFSTDAALGALESLSDAPRKAFRLSRESIDHQAFESSTIAELETLAGTSLKALLNRLFSVGAISAAEKRKKLDASIVIRCNDQKQQELLRNLKAQLLAKK